MHPPFERIRSGVGKGKMGGRAFGAVIARRSLSRIAATSLVSTTFVLACAQAAVPSGSDFPTAIPLATNSPNPATPTPETVVPRPGVPADLADADWFTSAGYAGSVGRTVQVHVPDGEGIFAVGDGFVASALETVASGSTTSTIFIRKIETGEIVSTWPSQVTRIQGVVAGGRLFWTGMFGAGVGSGEASTTDGGVWTVELGTQKAEPTYLLPPGEDLESYGEGVDRGPMFASPTGKTVAARVGGPDRVRTDVIDVGSLSVREQRKGNVIALSDDLA